jgi:hypothetical protein
MTNPETGKKYRSNGGVLESEDEVRAALKNKYGDDGMGHDRPTGDDDRPTTGQKLLLAPGDALGKAGDTLQQSGESLQKAADNLGAPKQGDSDSGGGGGVEGHAAGGSIPGSGSGDTVPAMLTPGEFVITKGAVQHYGVGLMHLINARRFRVGGIVDAFQHLNNGGLADVFDGLAARLAPVHFAAGGAVAIGPSSRGHFTVDLRTNHGTVHGLTASDTAAEQTTKFSVGKGIVSTGKKPSWYR